MAKASLWQRIKSWFRGDEKKSAPKPRQNRDARHETVSTRTSAPSYNRRALFDSLRDKKAEEEEKRVKNEAFKATKYDAKDIGESLKKTVKKDVPDPKQAAARKSQERAKNTLSVIDSKANSLVNKATEKEKKYRAESDAAIKARKKEREERIAKSYENDPKRKAAEASAERTAKKFKQLNAEQAEFHERTNHKYDVDYWKKKGDKAKAKEAAQRIRSGEDAADPVAENMAVEYHPKLYSATRGALSGATFGASDLMLSTRKGERAENEKYYQEHKSKGAEMAGEIVGSLASFGVTAGATDALGAKVIEKAAPRAAEKLAGTKLIQGAAKKSVTKAVEKGTIKGATKELVEQVGKDRAKKIVNAVGNDIVQNATTGLLYDFNKASAQHEIGSPEWWREMGQSAAFNAAITGAVGAGSAFTGGKALVKDAADRLINDPARRAASARAQDAVFGRANIGEDLLDRTPMMDGAYGDIRRGVLPPNEIEINGTRDINAPLRNAQYGRERYIKNAERIESLEATRERLFRNAGADATQGNKARLEDLVRVPSRNEVRISEINKELDEVSDAIGRARNTAPQEEYEALLDRFDELMAERNTLEESIGVSVPKNRTRPDVDVLEPYKRNRLKENPEAVFDETRTTTARGNALSEELKAEREALRKQYEAAKAAGEPTAQILDDMQEIDLMLKDAERKAAKTTGSKAVPPEARTKATPPKGNVAKEATGATSGSVENVTGTATKQSAGSSSAKKELPKSKAAKEAAEEAEDSFEPKMRGRYDRLNEGLKKETEGKVGIRKGIIAAEERASDEERKRIIKESGAEINRAIKAAHENAIHGGDFTYKVLTQGQRDDMFFDSYNKVKNSENVSQIVEELEEKMDKILRETEANPWGTTDQITLKDLSDMLAVEQYYKDSGVAFPPEYEEIMTRLTTLQGTQYGQGQRGRHLMLMERSPRYREAMMTKDVTKYISNVFGEDRFKDINRSLDKNFGEKNYLANELKRIANYETSYAHLPAEERRAAANEAYKELQKAILRNTKMSVWDAINLVRHTGMLSALATGGRNMLGNTSQFLMRELADKMTYFTERGLAKAGGVGEDFRPTTVLTYKGKDSKRLANHLTSGAVGKLTKTDDAYFEKFADPEYARQMTDVINDAVSDMMNIEKYETHAQKGADYVAETLGEKAVKGLAWLPRKTTKAVNFMLNEPDSWFVETRFRKGLMRYLEANGITDSASLAGKENILKDAIEHAKNQALEDTYKKANRVTSFLEKIRSAGLKKDDNMWRNLAKKGAMITLDAELPYLKVPVNVGINTVKYSPINVVKSLIDANTAIRRGDAKALSAAAEELSKGLTGTGLATLGFLLNCDEQDSEESNGFIAKARDELKEYGIKDYSLKIGDHVYDISNIGEGATQLLMGARAAEVVNENGGAPKGFLDNLDLVRECFAAPIDSIAEMGILDNALGIIDAFSNEGDYEKGFAERVGDAATNIGWDYAGQFIPQPLRGYARGTTSSDLDMGVKKGADVSATQKRLQSNVNKFVGAIPYVNEKVLPHKVDSHGNYVNERKTNQDKLKAVLNNVVNPVKATKVHVPEADKIEMSVKNDKGEPFKPSGFDKKREYKTDVGQGKYKETIDLTGKEREQVARAAKVSGYDMANALVKHGMFGDRLGARAQEILKNVPDDEEKAREMFFATDEWANADNATRNKYLNIMYGQGTDGKNNEGVSRTRKAEAYINIQGNSEGDFRYQNDLNWQYQKKYEDHNFAELGIDKGTYADVVQSIYDSSHKWDEENQKNVDTPNSAKKVKAGILAVEGLSPEQRVAIYQAIRGKRNGFGWYDWDGVSGGGSGYRRRGYGGYRHYGGGSRSKKVPALKQSSYKATKRTYKDTAAALKTSSSRSKGLSTASPVKVEPPKVKFKKYEV